MKKSWVVTLVVLLIVALAVSGVIAFRLSSRVRELEESRPDPEVLAEASPTEASPSPIPVPGITPREYYVEEAGAEVEDVLFHLAQAEQAYYDDEGEFTADTYELMERVSISPEVAVIQILRDATSFCIEAAHTEVKGTRRRFLSATSVIDYGLCNPSLPLDEQVPQPVPPDGSWQVSGVDVIDVTKKSDGYKRYLIPFKARWVGSGEPAEALCSWRLLAKSEGVVESGEFGFQRYEEVYKDRYSVAVYELHYGPPVKAELTCTNRY